MGTAKAIRHIHLTAACGTGMGTLACVLKEMGYTVTGSDRNVYPPMSDFLAGKQVPLFEGFDPANLDTDNGKGPDLVIIGNAVTRDNPEARAVMARNIPYCSMPQAVNRFLAADKKIILVTGTHGKTTTSSIMAHILARSGLDPSFMIGGILKDYHSSFRIGAGEYMVIEGDEYDTAFFDKGPKFMHYDPHITIMTGVEFDHADIFSGLDQIRAVFSDLAQKIKNKSHIIAFRENGTLMEILTETGAPFSSYGQGGDWHFSNHEVARGFSRADIHGPQTAYGVKTRLPGRHNMMNLLACAAAAGIIGITPEKVQRAMADFLGIKRRQEIRGVRNGITVMDDFAHHPSAVRETIAAVRPFYENGRIIAVFEPRTNTSMRHFFQSDYPKAFKEADMVCICKPSVKKDIPEAERFSPARLADDIRALGVEANYFESTDMILDFLCSRLRPEDLVLIMSNGGFDNIHARLLGMLE